MDDGTERLRPKLRARSGDLTNRASSSLVCTREVENGEEGGSQPSSNSRVWSTRRIMRLHAGRYIGRFSLTSLHTTEAILALPLYRPQWVLAILEVTEAKSWLFHSPHQYGPLYYSGRAPGEAHVVLLQVAQRRSY